MRIDREKVIDLLDVAVKQYGPKAMAGELNKGESTLRNELNINLQEQYKLGLFTALGIIDKTGDFTALDFIEEGLGRVAFFMPEDIEPTHLPLLMHSIARLTNEYSEVLDAFAEALRDGKMDKTEVKKCLKENMDVVKACMELKAHLDRLAK